MKTAIFEDDREFAARLESLVCQHTHFPPSCNTDSAETMLRFIGSMREPLLFLLDIVADNTTRGYDIADRIKEADNGSLIVFITDYPETIWNDAFYKALSLSHMQKSNPHWEGELCATLDLAEAIFKRHCLIVRQDRFETLYITVQRICYIEKIKGRNKIAVHCLDGEYIFPSTLKSMLRELKELGCPGQFVQCHKSFLINKFEVRRISRSLQQVVFKNGWRCPYGFVFMAYLFCVRAEHESIYVDDGR